MGITEQNRNTIVFIGLLLLAGMLHIAEDFCHNVPSPDYSLVTMLFCLVFMIYSGLLLFWIRSVHTRLLPSNARSCLIAAALLMLLYLSLRTFKYRIAGGSIGIRICWYAFYIPMTMIPALFLAVCIRIGRGEKHAKWDERLTLVPAGILSAVILTNDLHHLVFIPRPGIEVFLGRMGTYTYGWPFYLAYAWMILAMAAGIVLLVRACGSRKNRKMMLSVIAVILLWLILIRLHSLKAVIEFIPPYEVPEIHIFSMLAIFEICIHSRLIPHNENYTGFFEMLPLPLMITDRAFHPIYQSAADGIEADAKQLVSSLTSPVYPQPERKLSGRQIHGGYAFWIEDESGVRKANEKLLEANDLLESENTLIEYENQQKEENAYLRSRHQIYHDIAEEMYPYQKRIELLLNETEPGKESFRERIAMVSVLNAYVKRKTNMCLMASEKKTLPLRELQLAVSESGRYLFYVGIRTSVEEGGFGGHEGGGKELFLPSENIIALYDTFEMLAEQMVGHTSLLMVSFSDGGLRMAADAKLSLDLKGTVLPVHAEKREDILYLTVGAEKGDD